MVAAWRLRLAAGLARGLGSEALQASGLGEALVALGLAAVRTGGSAAAGGEEGDGTGGGGAGSRQRESPAVRAAGCRLLRMSMSALSDRQVGVVRSVSVQRWSEGALWTTWGVPADSVDADPHWREPAPVSVELARGALVEATRPVLAGMMRIALGSSSSNSSEYPCLDAFEAMAGIPTSGLITQGTHGDPAWWEAAIQVLQAAIQGGISLLPDCRDGDHDPLSPFLSEMERGAPLEDARARLPLLLRAMAGLHLLLPPADAKDKAGAPLRSVGGALLAAKAATVDTGLRPSQVASRQGLSAADLLGDVAGNQLLTAMGASSSEGAESTSARRLLQGCIAVVVAYSQGRLHAVVPSASTPHPAGLAVLPVSTSGPTHA